MILNRYFPLFLAGFHLPDLPTPPPGTIQCRCGCRPRFWPHVCRMAIMPVRPPRCFGSAPNCPRVAHAALNRLPYTVFGWDRAKMFSSDGRVNTTWK